MADRAIHSAARRVLDRASSKAPGEVSRLIELPGGVSCAATITRAVAAIITAPDMAAASQDAGTASITNANTIITTNNMPASITAANTITTTGSTILTMVGMRDIITAMVNSKSSGAGAKA